MVFEGAQVIRLHYFDLQAADPADQLLAQAIVDKVVPATCLLGGTVIANLRALGCEKPCDRCQGPRDRCHGTEELDEDEAETRALDRLDKLIRGEDADGPFDFYRHLNDHREKK